MAPQQQRRQSSAISKAQLQAVSWPVSVHCLCCQSFIHMLTASTWSPDCCGVDGCGACLVFLLTLLIFTPCCCSTAPQFVLLLLAGTTGALNS